MDYSANFRPIESLADEGRAATASPFMAVGLFVGEAVAQAGLYQPAKQELFRKLQAKTGVRQGQRVGGSDPGLGRTMPPKPLTATGGRSRPRCLEMNRANARTKGAS